MTNENGNRNISNSNNNNNNKSKEHFSLSIVPLKVDESLKHPDVPHEVLLQHEFSLLIVAPKGSGKTNLICNLITNHYRNYFHKILIISPTVNNDPKWDLVKKMRGIVRENKRLEKVLRDKEPTAKVPKIVFDDAETERKHTGDGGDKKFTGEMKDEWFFPNMDDLQGYLQEQQETIHKVKAKIGEKAKFVADRMLVVLDDQAGQFPGGNTPMTNYVIRHRHYSSSVIVVTQAYKAIPKTIRTNMNSLILFEIGNQSELMAIYEEFNDQLSQESWFRLYRHATRDPYCFLYYNSHFPKGERMYKNFTHRLREVVEEQEQEQEEFILKY